MTKTMVLSLLTLTALSPIGCIVEEPRRPVVYREYREVPAPAPDPYQEQYRPLPAPPPPPETVAVVEGPDIEVAQFHEQLAPYGRWVVVGAYGNCFVPADIGPAWRPYTLGHWVYTDSGMCWVSDEQWGWATYHYGRWTWVDAVGWAWVPGAHWGPAWVAWRNGGGYCGWAPLPPVGGAEVVEVTEIQTEVIPPTSYVFCEERFVTTPRVYEQCVPPDRNVTIIRQTTNITNITVINNRVVNRSWNVERIRQATGRSVRPLPIHEVRTVQELKERHPVSEPRRDRANEEPAPGEPNRIAGPPVEHEEREPDHVAREHPAAPGPGADPGGADDAEVRQINEAYARQKAEMNQRFAMERRQHQPGPGGEDMQERQAQEAQSLEARHQQQLDAARRKHRQQ